MTERTDEPFLTAKELAKKMGIDQGTLKRMRDAGTIRPLPIGRNGRYLYSQAIEQIKSAGKN